MKKQKNKLDSIFTIGIILIALIGGIIDGVYWHGVSEGGFPVYSCMSAFVSYAFWIGLLIYYFITKEHQECKPKYVSISMYFGLAFIHIFIAALGLIVSTSILNMFK